MNYFVTGSRAYGPYTESSDLDIVMLKEDADFLELSVMAAGLENWIDKTGMSYADKVWYFAIGGVTINVITAKSQIDFECWEEVTRRMVAMNCIVDKDKRVEMFHTLFLSVYDNYPDSIE